MPGFYMAQPRTATMAKGSSLYHNDMRETFEACDRSIISMLSCY